MKAAAATLAVLALLTTACTMSRGARTASIVSGAAVALGGMAITADADVGVDSDNNGVNDNPLNDNYDNVDDQLGGLVLVGLGMALIVAVAVADEPVEASIEHDRTSRRPASVTWTPDVMPYGWVPGAAPGMSVEAPMPPPRAGLPEVATDDVTLRMAQQARAAVERGNCDAAWSTWSVMNARDARYASALAASPVFASCPRATASY